MSNQTISARLFALLVPFAALAMTGCVGSDGLDSDSADSDESAVGVRQGVDYSWGRPSPSGLKAAGYTFAARYLSHDDSGKNISKGEADALIAAGVDVVLVWEGSSTGALGGYGQGRADAEAAAAQAAAAGMPGDRPIYFAVDFDAQASQQGTIDSYFDGVASVIGKSRTGAYGGYYLINRLFNDGRIAWGWQAYAWSYGNWDPRAQVRQVKNGQSVAGGSVDLDSAMVDDFGQWGHGTGSSKAFAEVAFQANTTDLWTTGGGGTRDWKLGMMVGTSPAIAVEGGDYEVAFQANTGNLWRVDASGGGGDQHLGMMKGTSPAICALAGGGYEVAFQANTGDLWTTGDAGTTDWKLGMMKGTSPAIACLPGGGFEVAFQANTSDLWTVGDAGNRDWKLGMETTSSPGIAALDNGHFVVAFEANTANLWVVDSGGGGGDQHLGMYEGTSPAIIALPGAGWEAAFQANTTSLWTVGSGGNRDWQLGMMPGTSPTLAPLGGNAFQASFEANTANLWVVNSNGGGGDQHLGMMKGTSPSGD